ncbi:hypothetical protein GIB67_029071 [Kingdonia uniflora]|uniref:Uncharacterized protein n=1 Tax=Kingdonia uniflora TaxID=39325 RepID=A0A7J7N6X8_9MAGN|nr:hypothetical protein GIB67_029071 [Kingdonia uniflora]
MASQNVRTRNIEQSYMRKLARLPGGFPYEDLKTATNNFRDQLGRGASGSVFKGILKDGSTVAVKRVDLTEYGKQFFEAEISTIASVRHVHLIRLRGYCSHMMESGGSFFVVYDLLPNGSLDTWIFPRMGGPTGQFLSWKSRYEVAVGVARALAYLHHDCFPPILHLDIKSPNILLDGQLRAVLCDFRLSKLTNEDGSEVRSKHIRGTTGYIAPELLQENQISAKCDMYSYGKVLLDLFFGQLYVCLDQNGNDIYVEGGNSGLEQRTFHAYMWERLIQKNLVGLIDKRLREDGKVDEKEAKSLVHVALWCLDEDPNRRPGDMRQVLYMLEAGKSDGIGAMVEQFSKELRIEKAPGGTFGAGATVDRVASEFLIEKVSERTSSSGGLLPKKAPSDEGNLLPKQTPSGWGTLTVTVHGAQNIVCNHNTRNLYVGARLSTDTDVKKTKNVEISRDPKWEEGFSFSLKRKPKRREYLIVWLYGTPEGDDDYIYNIFIDLANIAEKKHTNEMFQLLKGNTTTRTEGKINIELEWRPGKTDGIGAMVDEFSKEFLIEKVPGGTFGAGVTVDRFASEFLIEKVYEGTSSSGGLLPKKAPYDEGNLLPKQTPSGRGTLIVTVHGAQNIVCNGNIRKLYVEVCLEMDSKTTKLVEKSRDPKWEEEFSFSLKRAPKRGGRLRVWLNGTTKDYDYGRLSDIFISLSGIAEKKHTNEMYQFLKENTTTRTEGKINIELEWRPTC